LAVDLLRREPTERVFVTNTDPKAMKLIDGENMTIRAQALAAEREASLSNTKRAAYEHGPVGRVGAG
jgi:hypothetical protein